jgi:hypothetical protein
MEISDHLTPDDNMPGTDIALDTHFRQYDQVARPLRLGPHVADDMAADPQSTLKHDIALNAATAPDQGLNALLLVFNAFLPQHRNLACEEPAP